MTHTAPSDRDPVDALCHAMPQLTVSRSLADRIALGRDGTPPRRSEQGVSLPPEALPAAVCWPRSEQEVVDLVRTARRLRLPLVPVGGGTSLVHGSRAPAGSLAVDLKRLDRVVAVHRADRQVRVQAGVLLAHLEAELAPLGLTLGHDPASWSAATVGGLLATRSSGTRSFGQGNIAFRARSLRVVTGRGEVLETGRSVGPGPGPDWTRVFLGSEGSLGILVEATLDLAPPPETRQFAAYGFRRFEAAVAAAHRLAQSDLPVATVRVLDAGAALGLRARHGTPDWASLGLSRLLPAADGEVTLAGRLGRSALRLALSRVSGAGWVLGQVAERLRREASTMLLVFEGAPTPVGVAAQLAHGLLREADGRDLGPDMAARWHAHRLQEGFGLARWTQAGFRPEFLDTAALWHRLPELHEAVLRAATPHALVLSELTHVYPAGAALRYTFLRLDAPAAETHARGGGGLWPAVLGAVTRTGGSLGHHLGVGRAKARFLREALGTSAALLEALKASLDPDGILNPGVLGLP